MNKQKLAEALLEKAASQTSRKSCFIGFDGFTDEILTAIQTRTSQSNFIPFATIAAFGDRIRDAAGKSCNIELMVREKKMGGNAPIMANALLAGGHKLTFAGTIGKAGHIEPLFAPFADACTKVYPLGPSGHTDAIEFQDGKVILGKMAHLKEMSAEMVIEQIGMPHLIELLEQSALFVSANWTMLPMMNSLWQKLLTETVPHLSNKKRYLFVDLADPAKRTDEDLLEAFRLLKEFNRKFTVVQGLNAAEAERYLKVLKIKGEAHTPESARQSALALQQKLQVSAIVIHTKKFACAAENGSVALVEGSYTETPHLTTGAGDNFNAGYCNALLYGLDNESALLSGVATAGYYVRKGKSPTMEELAFFLRSWDKSAL